MTNLQLKTKTAFSGGDVVTGFEMMAVFSIAFTENYSQGERRNKTLEVEFYTQQDNPSKL